MKAYSTLVASVVLQMCLGGVYAWSVFVTPLQDRYGLSTFQTQAVFGLAFGAFTLVMLFSGRLVEARGPRLLAACGGAMFGCGYLLAGCSGGRFAMLLSGAGLLTGVGIGLAYMVPIATCVKWFPKHKGLVTGLAVAGFGGGAIILSAVAGELLKAGMDVLGVLRWIGLAYGLVSVAAACLLHAPAAKPGAAARSGLGLSQLVRDRSLWPLVGGMFAGTFAGMMVIGNLKPIAVARGLEDELAALAVSIFAVGNAGGRVAWGKLFDRLGYATIPASLALLALATALLAAAGSGGGFIAATTAVGFGFGGCFVLYAAQVAGRYGADRVGEVYPFIFLAYGLSGLSGAPFAGWVRDVTGSYVTALTAAVAVVCAGIMVTLLARPSLGSGCRV